MCIRDRVYVDLSVWEKIVMSLIFNAFRFTFDGSIGVSIEYRPDQVLIVVRDTGNGIPENELPLIFERFHQMPGARVRRPAGQTVGLPQVRELVQQHGGTIDVWSEEGRGTTFQIGVPTGWRSADTLLSMDGHPAECRILIVDNNSPRRDELARVLNGHFRVILADNAGAALEAIRLDRPDLIVSNVATTDLDGLSLVQD